MAFGPSEGYKLTEAQGELGKVEKNFITQSSLQDEIDGLQSNINENTEDQKTREGERNERTGELNRFRGNLETTRSKLATNRSKESNLTKTIVSKEGEVKSINSQIEAAKANAETVGPEETEKLIQGLETKKNTLQQEIAKANSERESVRKEISRLLQEEARITKEIADTEEKIRIIEGKIAALKQSWKSLNEDMTARSREMAELNTTIQEGQNDALKKQKRYQEIAEAEARDNDRNFGDNYFNEVGIFPFTTRLA